MKRLVFCFDGTWNQLTAYYPTNVVITAQSITPVAKDGSTQIIHYDPGVGTGEDDRWKGGLFGEGLINKVVDAYTFLVFNYEPGDELYVFGFSRGAFTARAFVGIVRNVGIIQRKSAARIADAVQLYKKRKEGASDDAGELFKFRAQYSPEVCMDTEEDAWRVKNCEGYRTGASSIVRIAYLGVWDTVGAIGVPSDIFFAKYANRNERYFDTDLSSMVVSARHAVSIDEQRKTFTPTLWPNFAVLNASLGFNSAASDAPYQQKWFPGNHGSVGGGGDVRGLSDRALVWILDGAEKMGLEVDKDPGSPLFRLQPDNFASLVNVSTPPSTEDRIEAAVLVTAPREHGPTNIEEVSDSALQRWRAPAESLPEKKLYRPIPLAGAAAVIEAHTPAKPQSEHQQKPPTSLSAIPKAGTLYKVLYGDTFRGLALRIYGHADREDIILSANPLITDANRIFIGQFLYLPPAPTAIGAPASKSV
jgi:uncharacterized protein (DUF2235 family)